MARVGKANNSSTQREATAARKGAAQSLPLSLTSRIAALRRLALGPDLRIAALPSAEPASLPTRLAQLVRSRKKPLPPPKPKTLRIPFVTPMIHVVRKPLARTAAAVQAVREVRTPRTRWDRLRDAARSVANDPQTATRWEHWMGLGLALAAGQSKNKQKWVQSKPRSAVARILRRRAAEEAPPPTGLRGLITRRIFGASPDDARKKAGREKFRDRPGTASKRR